MDSRSTKFQESEEYLTMMPRQRPAMQFNAARMSHEAMMHGNWTESVRPMMQPEYGMQPFPPQTKRVTSTPFRDADHTLPARYDPYGHVDLQTPFGNFPSQKRQECMWPRMDRADGGLYPPMDGMPQQFPGYMTPNQRGFPVSARNDDIQGTAMPPVGAERHGFPADPSIHFMPNSGRMAHPSVLNNAGRFRTDQPMPGPPLPDQMMRQDVNGYFNNERTQIQVPRDREGMRQRHWKHMPYRNGAGQWHRQNVQRRQVFAPGMPSPYDHRYPESGGLYPYQRHGFPNQMVARVQQGQRSIPGTPQEAQRIEQVQRTVRMPYTHDQARLIERIAATSSAPVPRNKEEGWIAFKKRLMPLYHSLDEALSICQEAYEKYRDPPALQCYKGIRDVIKFVKNVSNKSGEKPTQWYMLIPKVEDRAQALLRDASQIKVRLESPQSINSTVNTPMEEREDARGTYMQRSVRYPADVHRVSSHRQPHPATNQNKQQNGMEVIVLDPDESDERKDQQLQEEMRPCQLTRRLGNGHPPAMMHQPVASPQEQSKKRELAHRDSASAMGSTMPPRDLRRRINPPDNDKTQAGVVPTPKIKVTVPTDDRHRVKPSDDTNRSSHDHASVDKFVSEDALLTSAEIDELLQELEVFDEVRDWESSDAAVRDLKLGDDDWNYDRRFLEAAAEASAKEGPSETSEYITPLTFKHDVPITPAPEVTDVQVTQEGTEMDLPAVYQDVREECEALWKELNLKDLFDVQCVQKSDAVEIVVEVEGSRNKDGVFDWRRAIKLILGLSYPEEAPVISFAALPGHRAAGYAQHVFLSKVTDNGLLSISEILRLWFGEICPCHFENVPLQH